MRLSTSILALGAFVASGCDNTTEPVVCTAIAVSSLNVTVRDAATSQLVCDATVTSVVEGKAFELRRSGSPEACTYSGPEEQAGVFEVRAARPGYEATTAGKVLVRADECHVIPVQVTVELRPR